MGEVSLTIIIITPLILGFWYLIENPQILDILIQIRNVYTRVRESKIAFPVWDWERENEKKVWKIMIVVFSGAGLSAESGIPTFRGAGGLWEGYKITQVASYEEER